MPANAEPMGTGMLRMKTATAHYVLALLCVVAATWSSKTLAQMNLGPPIIYDSSGCIGASGGSGTCGGLTDTATYEGGQSYLSVYLNNQSYGAGDGLLRIESSFEVIGPAGETVPVTLGLSATTQMISGSGSSEAEALLSGPSGTILDEYACANSGIYTCQLSNIACCSATGHFPQASYNFTVSTNTEYSEAVLLFYYVVNPTTLSGTVDPDISFAQGFNSSGYSLIYSSNAPAVPLPATAWLLLSGLSGLGAIVWRRRAA